MPLFHTYRFEIVKWIVFLIFIESYGQTTFRFDHYTRKQALTNSGFFLVQDSLGFLWTSNLSGVARFDGYNFRTYAHDVDDTTRSPGSGSLGLLIRDFYGNIWLRSNPGIDTDFLLTRYDSKSDRFINYPIPIPTSNISRVCFDMNRRHVWLGTRGKGIYRYNLESKEIDQFVNTLCDSTNSEQCNWVRGVWDCGPHLIISTLYGLWKFDKNLLAVTRPDCAAEDSALLYLSNIDLRVHPYNNQMATVIAQPKVGIGDNTIAVVNQDLSILKQFILPAELTEHGIEVDTSDFAWIPTNDGLVQFDTRNSSWQTIRNSSNDPQSLPFEVQGLMIDDKNNLWVVSNSGISKLRKESMQFFNTPVPGIGGACSYTVARTNKRYLIGSRSIPGSSLTDIVAAPLENDIIEPAHFQILASVKVQAAMSFTAGKKMLWFTDAGSSVFGLPMDSKTGLPMPGPLHVYSNDVNNVNTIANRPFNLFEDPAGNLWVTTKGGGICKIVMSIPYGKKGSVIRYKHDNNNPDSPGNDIVWGVSMANDSSLWVITDTSIDLFHNALRPNAHQSFQHVFQNKAAPTDFVITSDSTMYVGTYRGLFKAKLRQSFHFVKVSVAGNEDISTIVRDQKGKLWLSSFSGVRCYDPTNESIISFTEEDGLKYTQAFGSTLQKQKITTRSGNIVLVDDNGLATFDPSSLIVDQFQPRTVLTSLRVNNAELNARQSLDDSGFSIDTDISLLGELTLDHKHNNFSLEFSAMEMVAPEENRYRHKLDGYDPDWIETDYKNRSATYTNLPSGTYTFRVKASNHHGVWSDQERTLQVKILPPPWRTWWAYALYSLFVVGLLFAARKNIVQRERLKSNLQLAKVEQEKEHFELEKAKEVDRVKTSFFTNISHEFRTPLTLIKGPVRDVLERYKDDPKLQQQLKLVERNSDLLLKLINQLLDLAKLDSGNLKIEKSRGELMRFVKAIASSFTSLAALKDISIHVDVATESCFALFDRDKFETILINLINNAIKFTQPNGIVNVSALVEDSLLTLKVKDNGIGIPEGQREKIFERFHQVSDSHKEVGTGIGLALVKELVSLLGGTIAVKSEVGKGLPGQQSGTEFIVTIPLEIVSSDELVEEDEQELSIDQPTVHIVQNKIALETATGNGGETRPHVLVVEDNADLRSFIIESLGEEFQFLEAENGRQGFDVATTEIPDLIVSDVMMPEMDGITMAEQIKGDVRTSHIPLILLTAKSTEASKLTGLESGADDYLTKPFNKHELLLKIRNGITRQRKLREKVMAELMGEAPRKEVLSADEQFLTKVKDEILKQLSNEQLSVESLAEEIGISRVHLYRKISGLTGMSVNELIRKLRLRRAAQLLQQQWGPVSQVAYEVGFSNLSYFSKVFKEEFGTLPSEYNGVNSPSRT